MIFVTRGKISAINIIIPNIQGFFQYFLLRIRKTTHTAAETVSTHAAVRENTF